MMQIETFFPYRLAVVAEALSRHLITVYGRKYGVSREEWRMLFLLADALTLDSLELAQRSSLDKVQVSRAAARLERKGMITRSILDADKRLRNYTITPKGQSIFQRAFGEVNARTEEILQTMSVGDRDALERGISALDQAIGEVVQSVKGKDTVFPRPVRSSEQKD